MLLVLVIVIAIFGWLLFEQNKEVERNKSLLERCQVDSVKDMSEKSKIINELRLELHKTTQSNNSLLLRIEKYEKSDIDSRKTSSGDAKTINELRSQLQGNTKRNSKLSDRIKKLEKYQDIVDTVKFIDNLKETHRATIEQEKHGIERYRKEMVQNAEKLINDIKTEFEDAKSFIYQHKIIAMKRIDDEAQGLLQEYYEIANEKKELKNIVKALENQIKGYSNEYFIPNQQLINDLIEGYDHLDAVDRLKSIRDEVKLAIKSEEVADCDYVEDYRRKTAIAFITNAFNGQVDAIFSRIRHDNIGKLSQEMKDKCLSLNNSGQAFRNVRITEKYLKLRLEELKWASLVQEFKLREREEQKEIREMIREEEKVSKEYEKAIKDAEKEEIAIKKAYEKVKKEFELASDDQKSKYEKELNLLNEKLKIAEEKSKRTLSMAQQTRAGHVYIISNIGSFGEDVFKVGMTRRLDPTDRVKELGGASVPFTFDIHAMIYSEDAPKLEKKLHHHFNHYRVNKINYRKEYFKIQISQIKEFLDNEKIHAKFMLKAEASQYRESLKIAELPDDEQRILEDKIEKEIIKQKIAITTDED